VSRRRRHFIIGCDRRTDGEKRITRGEDYLVAGGTGITHAETAGIVGEFSRRLRKEGAAPPDVAKEILREVVQERRRRN